MKLFLILIPFLLGITSEPKEGPVDKLIGSWKMVQYMHGEDESYNDVPEFIYYVKNVTQSHFSWCSYNPEDGNITGAGGGTFELSDKKYIESTTFWYPSGTSIPGTKTTFEYKLKGNRWTISGYIKAVEINPASGEMVPIDSTYISEVWMRL